MPYVSILTATYNRAEYLQMIYHRLCKQTCLDFEWIVCDDGSTDRTWALLKMWHSKSPFQMKILKQKNSGKHIALNCCGEKAEGVICAELDSDDLLRKDAVEWIKKTWQSIPAKRRNKLCGIVGQKVELETGKRIAPPLPKDGIEWDFLEASFIHGRTEENHKIIRTDVYRQFAFPNTFKGSYFPESVGKWMPMAKYYKAIYFNQVTYEHNFSSESVQRSQTKGTPKKQCDNMILAQKMLLENYSDYFLRSPLYFLISAAQYVFYNLQKGVSLYRQFSMLNGVFPKVLFCVAYPCGYTIYCIRNKKGIVTV